MNDGCIKFMVEKSVGRHPLHQVSKSVSQVMMNKLWTTQEKNVTSLL